MRSRESQAGPGRPCRWRRSARQGQPGRDGDLGSGAAAVAYHADKNCEPDGPHEDEDGDNHRDAAAVNEKRRHCMIAARYVSRLVDTFDGVCAGGHATFRGGGGRASRLRAESTARKASDVTHCAGLPTLRERGFHPTLRGFHPVTSSGCGEAGRGCRQGAIREPHVPRRNIRAGAAALEVKYRSKLG